MAIFLENLERVFEDNTRVNHGAIRVREPEKEVIIVLSSLLHLDIEFELARVEHRKHALPHALRVNKVLILDQLMW